MKPFEKGDIVTVRSGFAKSIASSMYDLVPAKLYVVTGTDYSGVQLDNSSVTFDPKRLSRESPRITGKPNRFQVGDTVSVFPDRAISKWVNELDLIPEEIYNVTGTTAYGCQLNGDATSYASTRLRLEAPAAVSPTSTHELSQHTPGAKLDQGKVMVNSILSGFPNALWAISEVGTFGVKKYTLNGWKEVDDGIRRYNDAAMRHKLLRQQGEITDPESGLPHAYHEAWNVLAALELELTKS